MAVCYSCGSVFFFVRCRLRCCDSTRRIGTGQLHINCAMVEFGDELWRGGIGETSMREGARIGRSQRRSRVRKKRSLKTLMRRDDICTVAAQKSQKGKAEVKRQIEEVKT